jgi:hypothetical protein
LISVTLPQGSYTGVVRGANNATGVSLLELYDLDPASSRITNISTRGEVGSGSDAMIGGFIIGGDEPTKLIVRAIGPSLVASNIPNALNDPLLELYDSNGSLIASNDNWRSSQAQQIIDSGVAPSDDREPQSSLPLTRVDIPRWFATPRSPVVSRWSKSTTSRPTSVTRRLLVIRPGA